MRSGILIFFSILSLIVSGSVSAQRISVSPARSQPVAGEELTVNYANVPPLSDKEFYLLFIFGGEGAEFYDSKPIKALPGGSVKMKPITKPGKFELVVYRYKDFSDTRPQQLARVPFDIVAKSKTVKAEADTKKKEQLKAAEEKKLLSKKRAEVERKKETVLVADTQKINSPSAEEELTTTSTRQTGRSGSIYYENLMVIERPKITTFTLIPQRAFDTEEEIVLNYEFPDLDTSKMYQVALSKPGQDSDILLSGTTNNNEGALTLKPLFEKGIYELRVMEVLKDSAGIDSIVHKQPIAIGNLDKSYPGRYNCWPKKPYIAGASLSDAPQPAELLELFTKLTSSKHKKPWLTDEDVCVEVQVIEYYPKTVVTFLAADTSANDRIYPAFPVRFVSRVVLNDFVNKKSLLAEDTKDRYFYFYKNDDNEWVHTSNPGSQKNTF